MDDKKLFETWKVPEAQEKMVFENHEGTYEQLAKKKSNDIFKRVKRNVIIEFFLTLIMIGLFCLELFILKIEHISIYLVIASIVTVIGVAVYAKFLYDIRNINKESLEVSLKKKIIILSVYIKQIYFFTIICIPISFFAGVFHGAGGISKMKPNILLTILCISIVIEFIIIWSTKKYIYMFYGKHLKRIRHIYDNLLEEEIH